MQECCLFDITSLMVPLCLVMHQHLAQSHSGHRSPKLHCELRVAELGSQIKDAGPFTSSGLGPSGRVEEKGQLLRKLQKVTMTTVRCNVLKMKMLLSLVQLLKTECQRVLIRNYKETWHDDRVKVLSINYCTTLCPTKCCLQTVLLWLSRRQHMVNGLLLRIWNVI